MKKMKEVIVAIGLILMVGLVLIAEFGLGKL